MDGCAIGVDGIEIQFTECLHAGQSYRVFVEAQNKKGPIPNRYRPRNQHVRHRRLSESTDNIVCIAGLEFSCAALNTYLVGVVTGSGSSGTNRPPIRGLPTISSM